MYLMSATCYANLRGTTIIKCKLGSKSNSYFLPCLTGEGLSFCPHRTNFVGITIATILFTFG